MRRFLLVVATALMVLPSAAPASPRPGPSGWADRIMNTMIGRADGSFGWISAYVSSGAGLLPQPDPGVEKTWACVYVGTKSEGDRGCGPLDIRIDEQLNTASVSGMVQSDDGSHQITVSVVFTSYGTYFPYVGEFCIPGFSLGVCVDAGVGRLGTGSGSVSSTTGFAVYDATGGGAAYVRAAVNTVPWL